MRVKEQEGFSLMEALMVVAIMAIVTVIAIPSFSKYIADNRLKAAARDVSSDITEIRSRAVAENSAYTITLNVSGNSYTIVRNSDLATESKALSQYGSGVRFQSTNYAAGAINVQTRGTVDMGNIVLVNNRNSTATITVNITGRTYVRYAVQAL